MVRIVYEIRQYKAATGGAYKFICNDPRRDWCETVCRQNTQDGDYPYGGCVMELTTEDGNIIKRHKILDTRGLGQDEKTFLTAKLEELKKQKAKYDKAYNLGGGKGDRVAVEIAIIERQLKRLEG